MPFNLSIARNGGGVLELTVSAGDVLFLLGANGTGKSSLMHHFYHAHRTNARRISAHRQTWFETSAITLSPKERQQSESHIQAHDSQPQARWREEYAAQRASIAIYDLVHAENIRAREITGAVDTDNFDLAKELRKKDAPIKIINELLRLSNIPVAVAIEDNAQVVANKNSSAPYSIAELSDGERNAILIAASVLTARRGTLLLIDEPERHLHRSIISPLLTLLFGRRPDCAFVVSTHDVMLSLDNASTRTLLIRGCTFNGSSVTAWDVDIVSAASGIDDNLKRDILGARRKILFVEGAERSLDKPLYSLVFPDVSVIAKGSCRDVKRAVYSVRDTDDLHWLEAFGLIDNDRRIQVEIDRLKEGGVYATAVFSVEGIYYHPEIQRRVAERHAKITGSDPDECLAEATSAAISAIIPHVQRLSERVAERLIREEFFAHIPGKEQISTGVPVNLSIDFAKIVSDECGRLLNAIETGDLTTVVSRYPVRETPALSEIVRRLGFQDCDQYEGTVRKLLMDETDGLIFVRSLFGTLAADIGADVANIGANETGTPPAVVA